MTAVRLTLGLVLLVAAAPGRAGEVDHWRLARRNAEQAADVLERCHRFVEGWLQHRDPETGLIPQNLRSPVWTPENSAADNYPFMVLSCYWTDREMLDDVMREMLDAEIRYTNRVRSLPDAFNLERDAFERGAVDHNRLIFGASEYCKDGLLPVTELMGRDTPWFERLQGMALDICREADLPTDFGPILADGAEVNGEMLQVLSRLYHATRGPLLLETALRIGDAYMLEVLPKNNWLPCHRWDFAAHRPADARLRLIDHGSEIVGGLSEVYVLARRFDRKREPQYRDALGRMLDTLVKHALKEDGLWYLELNTQTLEVTNKGVPDTWGYVYNALYTYAMATRQLGLTEPIQRALEHIENYSEWGGADAYADCIEGTLNLLNRMPTTPAFEWADAATARMSAIQKEDGVIEGWHGDGNVARTWLIYAMWKTGGVRAEPWRADLRYGAAVADGALYLWLTADRSWAGRLYFDRPRHRLHFGLPLNYPRLNEMPEWYPLSPGRTYAVQLGERTTRHTGRRLSEAGLSVSLDGTDGLALVVRR